MIEINGTRIWESLMEMAKIGATEKGGCRRLALTDLDRQGRDLFVSWCREIGALEVLRTLNDHDHVTEAPVEAICWTNEEGARFPPAMIGSGVWAGIFDLDYGHSRVDPEGKTIRAELERIGYLGTRSCSLSPVKAYYELHIEQGPVLEAQTKTVGIVTGGQGCNWYHMRLHGMDSHAGTTPMPYRRDALQGAARIIARLREAVLQQENALVTVGTIELQHNSINTIPGVWEAPTVNFDPECVGSVRNAAEKLGFSNMEIVSGAGHDACQMSHVVPTGMIFIPCKDGISHNEIESAEPEHISAGANVLLHAMLQSAG